MNQCQTYLKINKCIMFDFRYYYYIFMWFNQIEYKEI